MINSIEADKTEIETFFVAGRYWLAHYIDPKAPPLTNCCVKVYGKGVTREEAIAELKAWTPLGVPQGP